MTHTPRDAQVELRLRHTPERARVISVTVNRQVYARSVPVWKSLADFLREDLRLTGTHVGCEHGACGSCTVLLNDEPVRSCLLLAVQADGERLETVEGLAPSIDKLHPLQEAFRRHHGLQCGYCTPGILVAASAFLREVPRPTETQVHEMLSGHLCRCTGYQFIVEAIQAAAAAMAVGYTGPPATP